MKAHEQAKVESFQESIVTAVESDAQVQFDPDSLNPNYSYSDEHNFIHRVWMLDGVTAYNELRAAERVGVQGTAHLAAGLGGSFGLVDLGHHAPRRRRPRET